MNIALIPARSGSKRLPEKNIRLLGNKPLIAYSIESALKSNLFAEVIVSTDDDKIADIAINHGAQVPCLRPKELSGDFSYDIEWVNHSIKFMIKTPSVNIQNLAILRPTSPLRSSETIIAAVEALNSTLWADSLRAMEPTTIHPGKMWIVDENKRAVPYVAQIDKSVPTHDSPTQILQKLWIQNASLEIVRFSAFSETGSISGRTVLSFEMPGLEGFDINTLEDLQYLEFLVSRSPEILNR